MQVRVVKKAVFTILTAREGEVSSPSSRGIAESIPDDLLKPLWEADIDWQSEQEGILTVESNGKEQEIKLKDRNTALESSFEYFS